MAAQIDLSAPIYQGDGTGIVVLGDDEQIEPDAGVLPAITSAFKRMLLSEPGAHGTTLRAEFSYQCQFVGSLPAGFRHVRYDYNGRRDIRIHGHPSGRVYISGADFAPHVVWLLCLREGRCRCRLC